MYLNADGHIVLGSNGAMCRTGCGCASGDVGMACGKILATHSGLAGCLGDLNGVGVVLCPYYERIDDNFVCSGYPVGTPKYRLAWRGIVQIGNGYAIVAPGGVAIVAYGGVTASGSGGAFRNAESDGCNGITGGGARTLPTVYVGPLTIDAVGRTVTAVLHGGWEVVEFDGITEFVFDASATYTEITGEDCCAAECGYAELDLTDGTFADPVYTALTHVRQAAPYDCANCCRHIQFVYPGGFGPKLDFWSDGEIDGACLGTGVDDGTVILRGDSGGYSADGGSISHNYFANAFADDPVILAMTETWGCVAAGFVYFGQAGADMPASPPPGGGEYYGIYGSLRRVQVRIAASPVAEYVDLWIYEEQYAYRASGTLYGSGVWRRRYAGAQGPCPPTDAGAWLDWDNSFTIGGGPVGLPADTTAPTSITVSQCPTCGCACGAQYSSDFSLIDGTWSTPVRITQGCMPKWDAPLWPDPCHSPNQPLPGDNFIRAYTWVFYDTCACDLSGDACVTPDTIAPPDYGPACLVCPTDCPGCCERFGIAYYVDGVRTVAVVTRVGATFTSDDPQLTLECVRRIWVITITVAGRAGSPFKWRGNDAGTGAFGTCPVLSDVAAGWTPNFADAAVYLDSLICFDCPDCCASVVLPGIVSDVGFCAVLAVDDKCAVTVVSVTPVGTVVTVEVFGNHATVSVTLDDAGTPKSAVFDITLTESGDGFCLENFSSYTVVSSTDPTGNTLVPIQCGDECGSGVCRWVWEAHCESGAIVGPTLVSYSCSTDSSVPGGGPTDTWYSTGPGSYGMVVLGTDPCSSDADCGSPVPPGIDEISGAC